MQLDYIGANHFESCLEFLSAETQHPEINPCHFILHFPWSPPSEVIIGLQWLALLYTGCLHSYAPHTQTNIVFSLACCILFLLYQIFLFMNYFLLYIRTDFAHPIGHTIFIPLQSMNFFCIQSPYLTSMEYSIIQSTLHSERERVLVMPTKVIVFWVYSILFLF